MHVSCSGMLVDVHACVVFEHASGCNMHVSCASMLADVHACVMCGHSSRCTCMCHVRAC